MKKPLQAKLKAILHPKTHLLFDVQDTNRLLFNKYSYRLTVHVQKAYLFGYYRRHKFNGNFTYHNIYNQLSNAIKIRKDVLSKFVFPMEGRENQLEYDDIRELTMLMQDVIKQKIGVTNNNLHVYFETPEELLIFAKQLSPYYKERVVGLMRPAPNTILQPNVLLYKDTQGYKFLAVSHWTIWSRQDVQVLLNIVDSTKSGLGKKTKKRLQKFLEDGASEEWFDHIRIKLPDQQAVTWMQLLTGKKWKIYEIAESK